VPVRFGRLSSRSYPPVYVSSPCVMHG
jgi:hypothetical protein